MPENERTVTAWQGLHKHYKRKNSDTPMTEMTAPRMLLAVMGCLNSHQAGRIMMIGVSAISVLAIPAAVYCTASSEAPTPTNGPKMVVSTAAAMPLRSCRLR